jgi:malate dehydrogenase (oxaloacetate-decarboxylating)
MTTSMFLEAAGAIASLVRPSDLSHEYIVPSVFDDRVVAAVSAAVQHAARIDGVAGH